MFLFLSSGEQKSMSVQTIKIEFNKYPDKKKKNYIKINSQKKNIA